MKFMRLTRSIGFVPITWVYIVGVLCMVGIMRDIVSFGAAVIILGIAALLAMVNAAMKELQTVHQMLEDRPVNHATTRKAR